MREGSGKFWHAVREHVTHWVIGGALLSLTGFVPEEWFARSVQGLRIPDSVLHLWAAGVDVRVIPVGIGVSVGVIALIRQHRAIQSVPYAGLPLAGAAVAQETPGDDDEDLAGPTASSVMQNVPGVLPPPEEPSLAVLPFLNMSGDPEQEYFSDGVVEELLTALSRVRWLFVIARNSSFAYKGKSPDIRQVGRELGVRYVLEGSVRRAGERVRIAAQLVDAANGVHIWADRFDGDIADIFDLQDQVTTSVVAAIEPKLRAVEIERVRRKPTANLKAYDLFLRALPALYSRDRIVIEHAIEALERAFSIDPDYARAFALQALLLVRRGFIGGADPSEPSFTNSVRLALLAVDKGRDDPEVLWMAAFTVSMVGGDLRRGVALVDKSLTLNPHSSDALVYSSLIHAFLGDRATAISHAERALRLNPTGPEIYHIYNSRCVLDFVAGDYEGCCGWAARVLREMPDFPPTLRHQAASLGLLGRPKDAQDVIHRLLAVCPEETIARIRLYYAFYARTPETSATLDALLDGLRRAGLPEQSAG